MLGKEMVIDNGKTDGQRTKRRERQRERQAKMEKGALAKYTVCERGRSQMEWERDATSAEWERHWHRDKERERGKRKKEQRRWITPSAAMVVRETDRPA